MRWVCDDLSASARRRCYRRPPLVRVPTDTIAAPMFPASLKWLNVATLRMDKQKRPPGAPGVLGLLPPRVAAHAALPPGLARALRRGRAARDLGPRAGLPARQGPGGRRRGRASAWASSIRCCSTPTCSSGRSTRTRAGRRATCSTRTCGSSRSTSARAATTRPRRRSRSCWGSRARRPCPTSTPRTTRTRRSSCRRADVEGAYSGPYEAGAVVGGAGAARPRRSSSTARSARSTTPARTCSSHHDRHEAGVLELAVGDGVRLPRRLLHAGPRARRA